MDKTAGVLTAPGISLLPLIPVNCIRRESRQAHGNIPGSIGAGRTVLYPFSSLYDNCLPGMNIHFRISGTNMQNPVKHHRVLRELWSLSRFLPPGWTDHSGNAYCGGIAVHPSYVLLDQLGRCPGGIDHRWFFYENWHVSPSLQVSSLFGAVKNHFLIMKFIFLGVPLEDPETGGFSLAGNTLRQSVKSAGDTFFYQASGFFVKILFHFF